MKTRNSRNAPRNKTPGEVRFCNYYVEFPDGDVWSDYTHIVGGFHAWIKNTALWRQNPELVGKLMKNGEAHWKDNNGVTHRMVISDSACSRNWGLNKKIKQRSRLGVVR